MQFWETTMAIKNIKLPDLDEFIPLAHAARFVPGGGVHPMTVYRWQARGLQVGNRIVKLQSLKVKSKLFTTRRWLSEFIAAQQLHGDTAAELLREGQAKTRHQLLRELA